MFNEQKINILGEKAKAEKQTAALRLEKQKQAEIEKQKKEQAKEIKKEIIDLLDRIKIKEAQELVEKAKKENIELNLSSDKKIANTIMRWAVSSIKDKAAFVAVDYEEFAKQNNIKLQASEAKVIADINFELIMTAVYRKHDQGLEMVDFLKRNNIALQTFPGIIEELQKEVINFISINGISDLKRIFSFIEKHNLQVELKDSEVEKALVRSIKQSSYGIMDLKPMFELLEKFGNPIDLKNEKYKKAVEARFVDDINNEHLQAENDNTLEFGIEIDFTEKKFADAAKKAILNELKNGFTHLLVHTINNVKKLGIAVDFSDPQIVSAWQKALEDTEKDKNLQRIIEIAQEVDINLDYSSERIKNIYEQDIVELIKYDLNNQAIEKVISIVRLCNNNNIIIDLSKPEIINTFKRKLIQFCKLSGSDRPDKIFDLILTIKAPFDFADADFVAKIEKIIHGKFSEAKNYIAERIIQSAQRYGIPINLSEIIQKEMQVWLDNGYIVEAKKMADLAEKYNAKIDFSKPEIINACQKALEQSISDGAIATKAETIMGFVQKFNIAINLATISKSSQKSLSRFFFYGQLYSASAVKLIDFMEKYNIDYDKSDERVKTINKVKDEFGQHTTPELYKAAINLESKEAEYSKEQEWLDQLKIKSFADLRKYFRNLRSKILNKEEKIKFQDLDNGLTLNILESQFRFKESEWARAENEFMDLVKSALENKTKLDKEWKPSEVMQVATIDQEKMAAYEPTKAFLTKYFDLLNDWQIAERAREEGMAGIDKFLKNLDFENKIQLAIENLQSAISQVPEKAKKGLQNQIDQLQEVQKQKITDPQELVTRLSKVKELKNELRQLIIYMSFSADERIINENVLDYSAQKGQTKFDEVSGFINSVDHLLVKETLNKLIKDKKVRKAIKNLFSVKALEQELSRWQNQDSRGTKPMKWIASRGLMAEFSGYMADACWTAQTNICIEFPNLTALILVQNPDDMKNERLAGATLILDAKTTDGEDVMIVRGFNPQENIINQLQVEDFFEKTMDYLEEIARAKGVKKIIMPIGQRSGGSMTNRPAVATYLQKYKDAQKVTLASEPETEFNGYDILNSCRLIREIA